jgi:predicted O-methyltransferase YrrM
MDEIDQKEQPIYAALAALANLMNPQSYLEIGVRDGDSLKVIVEHGSVERLVLCDTWGGEYGGTDKGSHEHILPIVTDVPSVEFLDGDSKELIPQLDEMFDIITVDGDHSLLGCLTDMENSWRLLAPGGAMVIDDMCHPKHTYLEALILAFVTEKGAEVNMWDKEHGHGVAVLRKPIPKKEEACTESSSQEAAGT